VLLALDWFIYARGRDQDRAPGDSFLEAVVPFLYRPIVTATIGVAPTWIVDTVLA
jgi:hypothetical protein